MPHIAEQIVDSLPYELSRCFECGAESVGSVDGRQAFCAKCKDKTIAGIAETLRSVMLDHTTMIVQMLPDDGPFTEQYAQLAARGERLAQQIKDDTAELEKIKAQMRELGTGTYKHGGRPLVSVGPAPLKFDDELARSVLTLEQQAQVTKTVIDSQAVKVLFGEEVYNSCRKDQGGKASVSFPGAK